MLWERKEESIQGAREWQDKTFWRRWTGTSPWRIWEDTADPRRICVCMLSCFSHVWLLVTPWTVAPRLLCPWGLSRQEYWSGLPHASPGDLPNLGIEPMSFMSPALAGGFFCFCFCFFNHSSHLGSLEGHEEGSEMGTWGPVWELDC